MMCLYGGSNRIRNAHAASRDACLWTSGGHAWIPTDPKALAATSAAIALSISSAFDDASGPSSDGATDQGKDTGWQTAYAAVRMVIEVTEKSSDMFLPLKAVAGAISALMKNYDVSVSHS